MLNGSGDINWQELQQTQLGNYTFYNFGDYEFRAVGNGIFKIERINHATDDTYSDAEFDVKMADGSVKCLLNSAESC